LAKFFAHEYINQQTTKFEDVSPLYLNDDILIKFPPTLIEYGDYETLRDQIFQFALKLENLGIDITYNSRYEMTHNYPLFYFTKIPQSEEFFISTIKFIKKINKKN
jgi:acetyl esterase/lipase